MPYGDAGDLQFQIALVAPEPRHLLVGRRPSGETVGDAASLVYRVLHQFEAYANWRERGREIGAIANGGDRRVAGRQILVDDDAVIDRERGVAGQLGMRDDADADQDQIGGDTPAIGRLDPGNPATAPRIRTAPVPSATSAPQPICTSVKNRDTGAETTRPIG